jgi:hypothetical protein
MLEVGAKKGRDFRLEVRRIRSGASRDRPRDVVWLNTMAPNYHLIDVPVTYVCTNTIVPKIDARLPLMGSFTLGAQHGKDLRTSALHGTPSV